MTTRAGRLTEQALKVRRNQAKAEMLARAFVALCRQHRIPEPTREFRFAAPDRQWRFDFAWPMHNIALESEGGVWSKGAHTRGGHFLSDMEKYNAAALRGWRVFRTVPGQLNDIATLRLIADALGVPKP